MPADTRLDLLNTAWGVIANAGGGDWENESAEWREAAMRFRDEYHRFLDGLKRPKTTDD